MKSSNMQKTFVHETQKGPKFVFLGRCFVVSFKSKLRVFFVQSYVFILNFFVSLIDVFLSSLMYQAHFGVGDIFDALFHT